MKTKNNLRRFTEPMIYIILVAAFGFITTVVNHSGKEKQLRDAGFVSLTLENQIAELYYLEEAGVSL